MKAGLRHFLKKIAGDKPVAAGIRVKTDAIPVSANSKRYEVFVSRRWHQGDVRCPGI
jgi:hypothetical protein